MASGLTLDHHATVEAFRGDTLRLRFAVKDGTGAVKDLSSVSDARWAIYKRGLSAAALSKSLGAGITVTDAAGGLVLVAVSAGDTAALDPGLHEDELELTIGSDVQTVAHGLIIVHKDRQI